MAPLDLRADGGSVPVDARTEVEIADGRWLSLPRALVESQALRETLAAAIEVPCLRGHGRLRAATGALAAFPMIAVLVLDLRAASGLVPGSLGLVAADLVSAAFVGRELARRTPRMPRVAAAILLAAGVRLLGLVMKVCARGVDVPTWLATGLAFAAGGLWLARAPTASRVALELGGKLGLARRDLSSARAEEDAEVSSRLFAVSLAAALGLPLALALARRAGTGLEAQALLLVAYGALVPLGVARVAGSNATPRRGPMDVAFGTAIGLVAAVALAGGGDAFMRAGDELARCAEKLDAESRRMVASHAQEVREALVRVRSSTWLTSMTVLAIPFAEERIYRGVLLPVLVRRYGRAYGVFATSLGFAVLHASVYVLAGWQVAMLGFAFALAYLEGGILAAIAAHALWSLFQIV